MEKTGRGGKDKHNSFKTIILTIISKLSLYKHTLNFIWMLEMRRSNITKQIKNVITVIIDLCEPLYLKNLMKIVSRQFICNRTLERSVSRSLFNLAFISLLPFNLWYIFFCFT